MKHVSGFYLVLVFSVFSVCRAQTFIQEDFAAPSLQGTWEMGPGCEISQNTFFMRVPASDAASERSAGMICSDKTGKLNFIHTPLQVEFDDLDVMGTAPESASIFMMWITDDRSAGISRNSLQLRVEHTGAVSVNLYFSVAEGAPKTSKQLVGVTASLPIKKLTLTLNDKKPELEIEDGNGSRKYPFDWKGTIDPATWDDHPEFFINLRAVTKADPGTTEVSLKGFKATSEAPAPTDGTPGN